ncbi:hypothetical protein ACGF13_32490 [Kitasatospora sp. NPDC048286]|uniref:DUF7617 domain-containing protein n=1 Tax=Kitasatospora sp. NPDC048286 TaxID=3364047 RepID=UPI003710B996
MRRCPRISGGERRRHGPVALRDRLTRAALPLLVAFATASASFAGPASAHAADSPTTSTARGADATGRHTGRQLPVTLTKTGTDLATGSTTTAAPGDPIRWVVSATNPENTPVSTTITDVIQGGPGSTPQTQTYVPGSLQVPPGFSKEWSTNGGTTFTTTDEGTATNALQASNPKLSAPATGAVVPIPPPFKPVNTATGGDGFTPILFTATINGVATPQAWNIYHHGSSNTAAVVCTDLLSNGPCPAPSGAPTTWPQPLNSSVPGATTGDLGSTRTPTYVLDGSKLYYAAVDRVVFQRIGVGCIDLQAQASCGFTVLQEGSGTVIGGVVEGPNGLIYAVSSTGEILCYDRTANASCGTFNIGLPPNEAGGFPGDYVGTMTVVNGKVYATDNQRNPLPSVMGCFDPSTGAACTGWATPKVVVTPISSGPARVDNVFAMHDSSGAATGVCTIAGGVDQQTNPPIGTPVCFDFAGNPIAAPPGLQTLVSTNVGPGEANYQVPLTITSPNGHLETEFPFWLYTGNTPTLSSTLFCYDWTIQGPCAQYGTNGVVDGPPNVNGGLTTPYGFAYDGQCKYSLGDAGYLFSLDPVTGASPCLKTRAQSTINPSAYYCDGATGHVRSYGTVSLFGIDPTTVNFNQSTVTVLAADGTTIGTFPFDPATGTADISSVPIADQPIQVIGNIDLINDSSFTGGQPQMQVTFVGDAPQICYDTTVGTDCAITSVSDHASAVTNGSAPVTSNTATLQVTPGPDCAPQLTINKEVCTSGNAADCGNGGVGPWAKNATVAPGGTAYWRITVTNTGTVPITGITLTDSVSPSCVTAAGTFDLAAGASHQVFCDLTNVTAHTVNAVTATGHGPDGTPITTPPSEATVDVPSISINKEVCTSTNAADCVEGGPGPWAKSTTIPSGNTAYWRITVTNTGTVPVTGITLTDSVSPSCVTAAGTFDLAAGASHQVFCDLTNVTAHTVNTVTASFPGPGGTPITTPPSDATVDVTPPAAPSISINKEVCTSTNAADCVEGGPGPWAKSTTIPSGDTAYWRITVTNTGNVPVTGITLTDSVSPSCVTAAGTFDLTVGASHQVFCDLTNVTAHTVNAVTASGHGPDGTPVTTPPSEATVDVTPPAAPSISINKEVCTSTNAADCVDGGSGPWAKSTTIPSGNTAYWRITVTNTGTVPVTGITLTDSVSPSCVTAAGTFDLAVGASHQVFCDLTNVTTHTVNTVTASGHGPDGTPVTTPPSDATVDVPAPTPSISINKEVCTSTNAADCVEGGSGPWAKSTTIPSGNTAYWRITVTNTGTVPVTGITLTDSVSPSCVTAAGTFDLAAGASHQVFCDLMNVTAHTVNTVTASGHGPDGTPVTTPPSDATVDVTPPAVPSISINKEVCTSTNAADCMASGPGPWAKNTTVPSGSTAYWRITVTNTGNVPVTGITLTDSVSPSCVTAAGTFDLTVGASRQVFCDLANVTQRTVNTVTASFPGPGGTPITTPPSEATVDVTGTPSLIVDKKVCESDNAADCGAGGTGPWVKEVTLRKGNGPEDMCEPDKCLAFWQITVTNNGTADLTGITLNDAQERGCEVAAGSFDLAAGETKTFYCSSLISKDTVNTVTASYVPPNSPPGTAPVTTPPSSALARCLPPCEEKCDQHHPGHGHGHGDGWDHAEGPKQDNTGGGSHLVAWENPYLQYQGWTLPAEFDSKLPYLTTGFMLTDFDWLMPLLAAEGGAAF